MYNLPEAAPLPVAQPQVEPKRGANVLKWIGIGLIAIVALCSALGAAVLLLAPDYGTKIEYKASELYYTDAVTEAEARKVGDALQEYEYFGDNAVSVQLHKVDGTYQVRFVVQPDKVNDEAVITGFTVMGTVLKSQALGDAPTEVHLADDSFKTVRVLDL